METLEQAPWIEYIEINEETGERELRKDAPEEIKEAYELYLKKQDELNNQDIPVSK